MHNAYIWYEDNPPVANQTKVIWWDEAGVLRIDMYTVLEQEDVRAKLKAREAFGDKTLLCIAFEVGLFWNVGYFV